MAGNYGNRTPPGAAQDEGQRRLAVLIDADNAQASVIDGLLAEVAKFGIASVKRIYGDFTSSACSSGSRCCSSIRSSRCSSSPTPAARTPPTRR
jgi:hypothetical protein